MNKINIEKFSIEELIDQLDRKLKEELKQSLIEFCRGHQEIEVMWFYNNDSLCGSIQKLKEDDFKTPPYNLNVFKILNDKAIQLAQSFLDEYFVYVNTSSHIDTHKLKEKVDWKKIKPKKTPPKKYDLDFLYKGFFSKY